MHTQCALPWTRPGQYSLDIWMYWVCNGPSPLQCAYVLGSFDPKTSSWSKILMALERSLSEGFQLFAWKRTLLYLLPSFSVTFLSSHFHLHLIDFYFWLFFYFISWLTFFYAKFSHLHGLALDLEARVCLLRYDCSRLCMPLGRDCNIHGSCQLIEFIAMHFAFYSIITLISSGYCSSLLWRNSKF